MIPQDQLDLIDSQLDIAIEFGTEVYMIYYALIAMKNDPTLEPAQAIAKGVADMLQEL
jgi:hypothetical protein